MVSAEYRFPHIGLNGRIENNSFNVTLSEPIPSIGFNKSGVLFNEPLSCTSKKNKAVSVTGGATGTVSVSGEVTFNYSVAAAGTVVPPELAQIGIGVCTCNHQKCPLCADRLSKFSMVDSTGWSLLMRMPRYGVGPPC